MCCDGVGIGLEMDRRWIHSGLRAVHVPVVTVDGMFVVTADGVSVVTVHGMFVVSADGVSVVTVDGMFVVVTVDGVSMVTVEGGTTVLKWWRGV